MLPPPRMNKQAVCDVCSNELSCISTNSIDYGHGITARLHTGSWCALVHGRHHLLGILYGIPQCEQKGFECLCINIFDLLCAVSMHNLSSSIM